MLIFNIGRRVCICFIQSEQWLIGFNVIEQEHKTLLFLINSTVKQVGMDGDEKGLRDAKTTLLILCSHFTLTFKFGNCRDCARASNIY